MCQERYLQRRREAEESREIWQDFARTRPVDERRPPDEAAEPESTEVREAIATPER
jgi:hypothetical protein